MDRAKDSTRLRNDAGNSKICNGERFTFTRDEMYKIAYLVCISNESNNVFVKVQNSTTIILYPQDINFSKSVEISFSLLPLV